MTALKIVKEEIFEQNLNFLQCDFDTVRKIGLNKSNHFGG